MKGAYCFRLAVILLAFSAISPHGYPVSCAQSTEKSADRLDGTWETFSPVDEEFSVRIPSVPVEVRGRRYFYLGEHLLADFAIYSLVKDGTLFTIQSYKISKPKDLTKRIVTYDRKGFKFEGAFQSNAYKGKTFRQIGPNFSLRGLYVTTNNRLYIVEAARRDAPDALMLQFLESFTVGVRPNPATPFTNIAPASTVPYSSKEITRRAIVLSKLEPTYTPEALQYNVRGRVSLRATFSSNGAVEDISVLAGLPKGLTEQAIEACKTITFIPAEKDGKPVSQIMNVEYQFDLSP